MRAKYAGGEQDQLKWKEKTPNRNLEDPKTNPYTKFGVDMASLTWVITWVMITQKHTDTQKHGRTRQSR